MLQKNDMDWTRHKVQKKKHKQIRQSKWYDEISWTEEEKKNTQTDKIVSKFHREITRTENVMNKRNHEQI